nr:f-box/fbd/lrr-repeat protein [Quercus suber]
MEIVRRRRAIGETMNVSPLARKAKNQKLNDEQNTDRISNLPDAILQRILTLLETKDAVKTSTLSKRWQYLWMSITDLVFMEDGPDKRKKRVQFMNFVERVLVLLMHKVQVLSIGLGIDEDSRCNSEEPIMLPHCLFTSESLTYLSLTYFNLESYVLLKIPSSIWFSSLKTLKIRFAVFPDDRSMQRLLSGVPVLEDLTLDACCWWNVRSVCISAPMLKTLAIYETVDGLDQDDCQFLIFGMNLKYFYYGEKDKRQREVSYRVHKLLRGLSLVKKLAITPYVIEGLSYAEELLAHLPVFCNLTCLKFIGEPMNFASGELGNIIQKLPCLNSLIFNVGIFLSPYCEEGEWKLDPVAPCFSTHLKSITIREFGGTKGELHVVNFLLESALILESLVISECLSPTLSRTCKKKSKMFPMKQCRRWLWKNDDLLD